MAYKVGDIVRCLVAYRSLEAGDICKIQEVAEGQLYHLSSIPDLTGETEIMWGSEIQAVEEPPLPTPPRRIGITDPNGLDPHESGAKLDVGKPRMSLVLGGFSDALVKVAEVGTFGANKYTDDGWKTVANGQERYSDALMRHMFADLGGESTDSDSNLTHLAHLAWNALAVLQLKINEETNNGNA